MTLQNLKMNLNRNSDHATKNYENMLMCMHLNDLASEKILKVKKSLKYF